MNYLENISLKKLIALIKTEIKTNSGGSADRVTYDNTASGLAGSNVQEAIDELASNVGESFDTVIGTTWVGDAAPYTQEIAVAGLLENDDPITDVVVSDDYTNSQLQLEEFAKIYKIKTGDDKITVYANEKTTVSLPIQLVVARDKVMDIVGDTTIDLGGLEMVKLWENASPTSEFAAQTINVDLSGYDMVAISVSYNTTGGAAGSELNISKLIPNARTLMCCVCRYMSTTFNLIEPFRELAIPADKKTITFADGYSVSNSKDNEKVIPLAIYGIKGVK